jgi:hypothetical protein
MEENGGNDGRETSASAKVPVLAVAGARPEQGAGPKWLARLLLLAFGGPRGTPGRVTSSCRLMLVGGTRFSSQCRASGERLPTARLDQIMALTWLRLLTGSPTPYFVEELQGRRAQSIGEAVALGRVRRAAMGQRGVEDHLEEGQERRQRTPRTMEDERMPTVAGAGISDSRNNVQAGLGPKSGRRWVQ